MKKNYFLFLSSILLGVILLGTSCSSDDEVAPEAPSFPNKVTKSVTAGEVVELSFNANYEWTATISQSTYTYFQLLNGSTTTNTLSGGVGAQTIRVNVADVTVYDSAPTAEVTLKMNGESAVIATLTYPVTRREFAVYAPQKNEFGAFTEEYETTALGNDESLVMVYGTPELGTDAASTFYTPAKIVSNYAYTLEGPAWLQAVETGQAGETEYLFKADNTQIPASTEVATISVKVADSDTMVDTFDITITGADDYLALAGFDEQSVYTHEGNGVTPISGIATSSKSAIVKVCDANGAEVDWAEVAFAEWDAEGATIQDRMVSALSVEANTSSSAREAYVFVFAKNQAPAEGAKLVEDGVVASDYADNLATTLVQYSTPATIAVNGTLDETCTAFAEAGAEIDYWFSEGELGDLYIGSKYDIFYFGKDAEWGKDNSFVSSRPISQFKVYSYTLEGSFVELTSGSWIKCDNFYTNDKLSRFKIEANINASTAEGSLNINTGDYEAVILVEYNDGSYSAIYFHYNENAGATSNSGVAFVDPNLAGQAQATLTELKEGDELYDTYFAEYSSSAMPAQFYHLVYEYPIGASMAMCVELTGLDNLTPKAIGEWVSFDSERNAILMDAAGAGSQNPAAVVFKDENMVNKVVILCTLLSAE